jgi:hypothetical protein
MQISGHSTRSVFDRYDVISQSVLETASGKIGLCNIPSNALDSQIDSQLNILDEAKSLSN